MENSDCPEDWVIQFSEVMDSAPSAEKVLNHLVQLGVSDPSGPLDILEEEFGFGPERMREFNRDIWELVKDRLPELRRVLMHDVAYRRNHLELAELVNSRYGGMRLRTHAQAVTFDEEYGQIASRAYGIQLLKNFLCGNPSWC